MTNWKELIKEFDARFYDGSSKEASKKSIEQRKYLMEKLTNLITEILDSCPLEKHNHHDFTQDSTVHDTTVITMFLKNREVDGYNRAVAEFEKWKKEVLG